MRCFTRQQALDAGHTPRTIDGRLKTGRWIWVHPGIYVIAGASNTWEQGAIAAQLWAGSGSALSHLSAAAILGLREGKPLKIDLSTPRRIQGSGVSLHRTHLADNEIMKAGCFVVTSGVRTLVDLASVLDESRLEDCLEEGLFRRLLTLEQLQAALPDLTRGRKGAGTLRRLVELRDPTWSPTENNFETLLFRTLRRFGLPLPLRQQDLGRKRVHYRLDFAYPEAMLGMPADSYARGGLGRTADQWHGRRANWDKDIRQRNRLIAKGWVIRPTTWTELKRSPETFAADIRRLLARRTGEVAV